MRKSKSSNEWWKRRIKWLIQEGKAVKTISPKVFNKTSRCSPIKLVILGYFIPVYTPIAKKYFNRIYYLDLFSGSGLNKVDREGQESLEFAGSPVVCAYSASKSPFTKLFLFESNQNFNSVIKRRLKYLESLEKPSWIKDRWKVFPPNDVNLMINKIVGITNEIPNSHSLIFIDPWGLELNWTTLEVLLKKTDSDIMMYFDIDGLWRNIKAAKSESATSKGQSLKNDLFLGGSYWNHCRDSKEVFQRYMSQILPYRAAFRKFEIKDKGTTKYYVLFLTKREAAWLRSLDQLSKYIERIDGSDIETLIDIIEERQASLDDYSL